MDRLVILVLSRDEHSLGASLKRWQLQLRHRCKRAAGCKGAVCGGSPVWVPTVSARVPYVAESLARGPDISAVRCARPYDLQS